MKKLYRSRKHRIIGGVCGGIAEYFEIDPVLVRLIWVILIIFGGIGVLAYIIAWIIIPKQEESSSTIEPPEQTSETQPSQEVTTQSSNKRLFWGIVLIIVGLLIVANQFWWPFDFIRTLVRGIFKFFIPAVLIVLGIFIILQGKESKK
ncbi:MAG TPA: PspC domain-containing protein [Candidatus Marinimicrobia bacterium]|nr:PspC domain-containing protein [Candidatus Neomarinimicrobiota bacterium]HRS51619.1 PspC domain-containing protein [Candidatus Neomarinimicrobiota bacterium]HRU92303.1 PspC domain-containing protein [Candidatus Neomarinimicrobiota bacterium]